ncbi:hypothetical protein [Kitasatospora sp. NBC_01266]|uniref:hypothetical protein n=1 Tax=Kitasatospora sp. NBC_01266 TaxID=2903572 RepID=UPI002E307729|nr:hypothetical protein [Kitasatospora sp. NBC_01266]
MKRNVTNLALMVSILLLSVVSACDVPDHVGLGCKQSTCHLNLESGKSVTIGGQTFAVDHLSDDSVTLDSHGISLTVHTGVDVTFGRYHLKFNRSDSGSAALDVGGG